MANTTRSSTPPGGRNLNDILDNANNGGSQVEFANNSHPTSMTSAGATAIAENVIENYTVPEVAVPSKEQVQFAKSASSEDIKNMIDWSKMTENDILSNSSIVAVAKNLPKHLDLTPKNPEYIFRWVEFKRTGPQGNRHEQLKATGFTNVLPEECNEYVDTSMVKVQDGGIVCYDVILMKCHKSILLPIYAHNMKRANNTIANGGRREEPIDIANQVIGENRAAGDYLEAFVPQRRLGRRNRL